MTRGAIAAVAVAVALAGCGSPSHPDVERAERIAAAYGRAYAAADGDAACRLLAPKMRARYERDGERCPERFATLVADRPTLRLESARITAERDDGLRGILEFSEREGPGMGGEVHLAERDGTWRLDLDLSWITPSCDP